MKNEKLRQKKLEKTKLKRKHHNAVSKQRNKCNYGNYKLLYAIKEHERIISNIKKGYFPL